MNCICVTFLQNKSEIDHAAEEFKAKTEECTASMLNKLGLLLMKSNQQNQVRLIIFCSCTILILCTQK